jgi:hypothetical protein
VNKNGLGDEKDNRLNRTIGQTLADGAVAAAVNLAAVFSRPALFLCCILLGCGICELEGIAMSAPKSTVATSTVPS